MKLRCRSCNFIDSELCFPSGKCPQCEGDSEYIGPFYVNTYLVDRAYGGSEEGGWWYDCGEPIDSRQCDTYEEALKVREEREMWCRENNKGRRPLYSVLSNGEYRTSLEAHFAKIWPDRKPHYE